MDRYAAAIVEEIVESDGVIVDDGDGAGDIMGAGAEGGGPAGTVVGDGVGVHRIGDRRCCAAGKEQQEYSGESHNH